MATQAVGEDIEALCGKCGQVWHVVMAKVGTRIAKVVCKRCHGQHLYRTETPDGPVLGDRAVTSGTRKTARTRTPEVPEPPPIPPFDPSKPPRAYAATGSFVAGDRVNHATFGTGVVTGSPGAGKVEVAFPAGRRVLACAKTVSTLERPTLARHVPIADRPPEKVS
jgi:hypothetical protein